MGINKFEDLIIWQKSKELTVEIYKNLGNIKDYGFKDQIQRASVSIMNNIAEGFERKSNKEFKYFLYIAKGSSGEVRSLLHLALELEYINLDFYEKYSLLSIEISKMIQGFIKTLDADK